MNTDLLRADVQQYIIDNLKEDPHGLALKKSPFAGIPMPSIAAQIAARKRVKTKLPGLYDLAGLFFPPKLNLEQSSSERTAEYKASLLKGETLLDLTGGLGIDSMAFADNIKNVSYSERNLELANIAEHNFKALKYTNIEVIKADGLAHFEKQHWDIIYCDPDRRVSNKRAYQLSDCEPNVVDLQDSLLNHCKLLLIKAAPMLDIEQAKRDLKHLRKIVVVALKGEVKELLLFCTKEAQLEQMTAVNILSGEIHKDDITETQQKILYSEPQKFLYIAHGALMKLQAYDYIAAHYGLYKIAPSSHLFTADTFKTFPGRTFKVKAVQAYNKRNMSSYKNSAVLVIARNFPLNVAQLRGKWKLKDAGKDYLIFTTLGDGSKVVITAELVS